MKEQKSLNNLKFLTWAGLIYKGNIIDSATSGYGSNIIKYKCSNKKDISICNNRGCSGHAERILLDRYLNSLNKNNKRIKTNKYSIIIIRYDANGNYVMAKPCSLCAPVIRMAKIKNVWYSISGGIKYEDSRYLIGEDSSGTKIIKKMIEDEKLIKIKNKNKNKQKSRSKTDKKNKS